MTRDEKIVKLRESEAGFILFSKCTGLPYIECEKVNYFDQMYFFDLQEDAEEMAKKITEAGDQVGVAPLNTVAFSEQQKAVMGDAVKGKMRNQVREMLMRNPMMGIGAICYKAAGEEPELFEMEEILPGDVMGFVKSQMTGLENLRMTGLYLAQCLRRENKNMDELKDLSEEFYANLVDAQLLVSVIPSEDQINETRLDMGKCRQASFSVKNPETGEMDSYLTAFTNMDEVSVIASQAGATTKVVRVPFEDLPKLINESMPGVILDPFSLRMPIPKADIPQLVQNFRKSK